MFTSGNVYTIGTKCLHGFSELGCSVVQKALPLTANILHINVSCRLFPQVYPVDCTCVQKSLCAHHSLCEYSFSPQLWPLCMQLDTASAMLNAANRIIHFNQIRRKLKENLFVSQALSNIFLRSPSITGIYRYISVLRLKL